jgi:hypothetical protein
VARFDAKLATPIPATLEAMRRALEAAGVRFMPDGSVRPPDEPEPDEPPARRAA